MVRKRVERLEALRGAVAASHAAVVLARGKVIEAVGDKLCGDPAGPAQEDLKALTQAREGEASAKARLRSFVSRRTRELIDKARFNSSRARARGR